MKKIFLIILAAMCAGCARETDNDIKKPSLMITVGGFATETRSAVNYGTEDYFTGWNNGLENIQVIFDGVSRDHTYSNGTLVSTSDAFMFPTGGNPVDVSVKWPSDDNRKDTGSDGRKDQSTKEGFMAEDWLIADMKNVMPSYSLSIYMRHERVKISFVLAGALDGTTAEELTFGDFRAFCNDGRIELMIDPGTDAALFASGTPGTIKTAGSNYTYTLDADITGIEPGSYHEIILNL